MNYRFAVQDIEPGVGKVEVFAVDWPIKGRKKVTPIPLISCNDYATSGGFDIPNLMEGFDKIALRHDAKFLCPDTTELPLKGDYHSD